MTQMAQSTTIYNDSTMLVAYCSDAAYDTNLCIVKFYGTNGIAVEYQDHNDRWCTYQGREIDPGHYKLELRGHNNEVIGNGTLHRFLESSDVLEGGWRESGTTGFWRIVLGKEDDDEGTD